MTPSPALSRAIIAAALAAMALAAQSAEVTLSTKVDGTFPNDEATIRLSLTREAETSAGAQKALIAGMNQGMAILRKSVEGKDAEISSGRLYTFAKYSAKTKDKPQRIDSWVSRQTVSVKLHDTSLAGSVMGAASGTFEYSGLSFSLSRKERENRERDLINEAMDNLSIKAKAVASSLKVSDSRVRLVKVSFDEPGHSASRNIPLSVGAPSKDSAKETTLDLSPGLATVTVSATAVYEIGDGK